MQTSTLPPALASLQSLSDPPPAGKPNILGTPLPELETFVEKNGLPKFRAQQIFHGIFRESRVRDSELWTADPNREDLHRTPGREEFVC